MKSSAYTSMSTSIMGQSLIYNHMSHHYRRLYNARSRVDSSSPQRSRLGQRLVCSSLTSTMDKCSSPKPTTEICDSLASTCDITPNCTVFLDELVYDTKLGPAVYCSQMQDCWNRCCNCSGGTSTRPDQKLTSVPVASKPKRIIKEQSQQKTMVERHSRCFDPSAPYKPRTLKSDTQSKLRDLKVYHPPRKKSPKKTKGVKPTNASEEPVKAQGPGRPNQAVELAQEGEEAAATNHIASRQIWDSPVAQSTPATNHVLSKEWTAVHPQKAIPERVSSSRNWSSSPVQDTVVPDHIGSKEEWKQEDQVDDGISSASSAGPWTQIPMYIDYPPSSTPLKTASEQSSRDSAYNGGVSSGGESRGPTPEQSPGKPSVPSIHLTPAMEARLKRQKEDALYVQFVHDITQDVLTSGIFSNKGLRQVFQRHINLNKNKLNMERMKAEVARLQIQLDMPDDDGDTFPFPSKEDIVLGWPSPAQDTEEQFSLEKTVDKNKVKQSPSEVINSLIQMGFTQSMAEEISQSLSDKDLQLTPELCRDMSSVLSSREEFITRGSPRYSKTSAESFLKESPFSSPKVSKKFVEDGERRGHPRFSKPQAERLLKDIIEKFESPQSSRRESVVSCGMKNDNSVFQMYSAEMLQEVIERLIDRSPSSQREPSIRRESCRSSEPPVKVVINEIIDKYSTDQFSGSSCVCVNEVGDEISSPAISRTSAVSRDQSIKIAGWKPSGKEDCEESSCHSRSLVTRVEKSHSSSPKKTVSDRKDLPRYSESSAEKILGQIIEQLLESPHSSHRELNEMEVGETRSLKPSAEVILREIIDRYCESRLSSVKQSQEMDVLDEQRGSPDSEMSVAPVELLSPKTGSITGGGHEGSLEIFSDNRSPSSRTSSRNTISKKLDLIHEASEQPEETSSCVCPYELKCRESVPVLSGPRASAGSSNATNSEVLVSSSMLQNNSVGSANQSSVMEDADGDDSGSETEGASERTESGKSDKLKDNTVNVGEKGSEMDDDGSVIEEEVDTADDKSEDESSVVEEISEHYSSSYSSVATLAERLRDFTVDKEAFRPSSYPHDEIDLLSREELMREHKSS